VNKSVKQLVCILVVSELLLGHRNTNTSHRFPMSM